MGWLFHHPHEFFEICRWSRRLELRLCYAMEVLICGPRLFLDQPLTCQWHPKPAQVALCKSRGIQIAEWLPLANHRVYLRPKPNGFPEFQDAD